MDRAGPVSSFLYCQHVIRQSNPVQPSCSADSVTVTVIKILSKIMFHWVQKISISCTRWTYHISTIYTSYHTHHAYSKTLLACKTKPFGFWMTITKSKCALHSKTRAYVMKWTTTKVKSSNSSFWNICLLWHNLSTQS